jgi:hypothetical protein
LGWAFIIIAFLCLVQLPIFKFGVTVLALHVVQHEIPQRPDGIRRSGKDFRELVARGLRMVAAPTALSLAGSLGRRREARAVSGELTPRFVTVGKMELPAPSAR